MVGLHPKQIKIVKMRYLLFLLLFVNCNTNEKNLNTDEKDLIISFVEYCRSNEQLEESILEDFLCFDEENKEDLISISKEFINGINNHVLKDVVKYQILSHIEIDKQILKNFNQTIVYPNIQNVYYLVNNNKIKMYFIVENGKIISFFGNPQKRPKKETYPFLLCGSI